MLIEFSCVPSRVFLISEEIWGEEKKEVEGTS